MHYQIATHEASNKQKTRDCKAKLRQIERTICKPKNGARNQQKEFEDLIAENSQVIHSDFDIKDELGMDSGLEGDDEELDGLGLDDLLDDLLPNEVTIPKNSLNVHQNLNTMAKFLMKIEEDVASNVDFPDFMICFNGEQKTIGAYSFPLSLVPTVERIIKVHGDVSASSSVKNSNITGKIFLFFCATIREMEDLKLHEVTEKKMLTWRDAIKDALRINFKVEFAMSHLKKIARAYFGGIGAQVLQTIDDKLDALHKERAEAFKGFEDCLTNVMDFHGQPVSTGLFP
ncbi:uncharacterized protein LOC120122870 [Hibiscus syriacus]|uniref:uncharacterized protein LOC120122870 n=1 Tax=Hibiscus syriacus TaxID=106335 RepID=UPI001922C2B9|nr:uncharacterized protein LOC120122870 [Hibiscus syriacus]XP_038997851.1 uncharacterized protein LOC120122870 [Hibiscus syriacus]